MALFVFERVLLEIVSAIACVILVRFMIKPYQLTGEARYLGLPLGFGFLGVSYFFSAIIYSPLLSSDAMANFGLIQLLVRGFAFLFLAVTYYFSKSEKKVKFLWNTVLASLTAIMIILFFVLIISPELSRSDYLFLYLCSRFFGIGCLCYITIHALKSHLEESDSATILAPFGYLLLAISQYSAIIWGFDSSYLALFGALLFRLAGLAIFLYSVYRGFYGRGT